MSKQWSIQDSFGRQKEIRVLKQPSSRHPKDASRVKDERAGGSGAERSDRPSSSLSPAETSNWHRGLTLTPKTKSTSKKRSRQEAVQDHPIPFPAAGRQRGADLPKLGSPVKPSQTNADNPLPPQSSSSLSSLTPTSSQPVLFSSCQRREKNGQVIVISSDGDTSDSDSDSLPDPEALFGIGRARKSTPPTEPEPVVTGSSDNVRRSTRLDRFANQSPATSSIPKRGSTTDFFTKASGRGSAREGNDPVQYITSLKWLHASEQPRRNGFPEPRQRSYKFDLKSLVKHNETETLSKQQQREILETLKAYDTIPEPALETARTQPDGREEALLAQVVQDHGSEGDIDRLLLALQRTESLQRDVKWSFFRSEPPSASLQRDAPLLTDSIWGPLTKDGFTRANTYLSGFAQDLVADHGIPDELIDWLIDAVAFEPREDLRTVYVQLLSQVPQQLSQILTIDRIEKLLRSLGAKNAALNVQEGIRLGPPASGEQQQPRAQLPSVLTLIAYTAPHFSQETRQTCLHLACRLIMDDGISRHAPHQQAVDGLIIHLLESLSADTVDMQTRVLLPQLTASIPSIPLRAQLVSRFPLLTPRTSLLRIRIATHFLLRDDAHPVTRPPTTLLPHILAALDRPPFPIDRSTDYPLLAAHITFLSAALSGIALPLTNPKPNPTTTTITTTTTALSPNPNLNPNPNTDPDRDPLPLLQAHDAQIDHLAAKLKATFNDIIDTGASHMQRTQVKQELESLHGRVLYAMRTRRKRRTLMLGEDGAIEGASVMRQGKLTWAGGRELFGGTGADGERGG